MARPYAEVSVDGVVVGTTPIRAYSVQAGEVLITLTHPTYGKQTRRVTIKPGQTRRLDVDMRR